MLEFQEKRKLKRFLYSKITLVVLIVLIALALNAVWGVYKKQDMTKDNLAKTAATYNSLQDREKILSSEIERLETANGLEEEIREKYGLIKPGEEVIIIIDEEKDKDLDSVSSSISFWQKIKNLFK